MLFNSVQFLFFFVTVTGLYFVLPHKFRWMLLLASSCYFYMAFVPIYILILGFTIVIDYFAGIMIENSTEKKRRLYLILSLIANIGVLAIFKYYNFINENLSFLCKALGGENPIPFLKILLPIGLSFHTFQAMSYTIEVYRGNQKAERHFGIYALYVMFYPQLVAGPIERPQNLLHQFYEQHYFDYKRVTDGLKLMLWGFFKKVVIADNLALLSNVVYGDVYHYKGLSLVVGMLAFTVQIFCDFSGYSDIAIGSAQVMGFDLMTNFKRPFFSKNITEFWRRWHISLSTWFNDYLYTPIVVNRRYWNKWGVVLALLITFLISGLWHGAAWKFIIYGLLHGLAMIFEVLTKKTRKNWSKKIPSYLYNPLSIFITIAYVSFSWIFFRANNVHDALYVVKNIFKGLHLSELSNVFTVWEGGNYTKLTVLASLIIMKLVHHYQENYGSMRAKISMQILPVRWIIYIAAIFAIILLGAFQNTQFIYFQF